jgi:23S rRNA pseudouridine2605 synthase
MTDENRPEANDPEANEEQLIDAAEAEEIEDPIGDETDGEAAASTEDEAEIETAEDEAEEAAEDEPEIVGESGDEDETEPTRKPRPPAKPERLQKILAAAGVASRRKAEEMIEQGRVQVNGKVITEPGTKADLGRDHIRVDGKLLHGAERHRYFVLNKPRGFVTTVKDPEGRPTVMQFFDKMRERLYPVGRLDYMSEGLLLVTNDGELANKLTRASAGVEKTYLVKVAGIPSEAELDILRSGVAIDKGAPGSGKVRTSPARIRQVRQGDNPWYEVVLIEGRNRELRKMFEEVGHFVEKIRRVGYGPLILDQEPGNLRELDEQELELLRKAADGKLRTPKAKEIRRRNMIDSLPPEKPAFRPRGAKPAAGPKDYQPKKTFGTDRPTRSGPNAGKSAPAKFGDQPTRFGSGPARPGFSSARPGAGPAKFGSGAAKSGPAKFGATPSKFGSGRPTDSAAPRPAWKKDAPSPSTGRPPARFASGSTGNARPSAGRTFGDRPAGRTFGARSEGTRPSPAPRTGPGAGKPFGDKPAGRSFPPKPAWKKPESGERPAFKRPSGPRSTGPRAEAIRRPAPAPFDDDAPRKSFKLHIEPVQDFGRPERSSPQRPRPERSQPGRPTSSRPPSGYSGPGRSGPDRSGPARSGSARPGPSRPRTGPSDTGRSDAGRSGPGRVGRGRPSSARPASARPASARPASARPFRSEGGLARPFTTSSGKPRAGGPRPSSKPGRESGGTSGWKPKPGGFSKSGPKGSGYKGKPTGSAYKGKPSGSGSKRTGPRPGGKKPGGKRP